jgi:serine protease Do
MRFPTLNKKRGMALLGILFIVIGGVSLLLAQRQPAPQIVRVGIDGAYVGITMEDVTADNMAKYKLSSETGVIVRSVEKGSPAEAARLQENDVILEYAGIPVFSAAELTRLVQETPVGRTVNLVVSREGKKINLTVKIAERKGAVLADRLTVITPNDILRRFEFNPPGSGVFQFTLPNGRSRTLSFATPSRPQLGITVEAVTDQMAEFLGVPGKKGVLITSVTAGSPAASVLRAGDVILSIDGKAVADPQDLTKALSSKAQGAKVELKVIRDKKEISVSVDLSKSGSAQRRIIL